MWANLGHITRRIPLKTKEEKVLHHLWSRRCSEHCLLWTLHFDEGNGTAARLDRRSSRSSGTCYYDAERSRKVLLAKLLGVRDGCESCFPTCEGLSYGSRNRFILGVRDNVWKLEVA